MTLAELYGLAPAVPPGYAPPGSTAPTVASTGVAGPAIRSGAEIRSDLDQLPYYIGPHATQALSNASQLAAMFTPKFGFPEGAEAGREIDAGNYGRAAGALGFGTAGAALDMIPGSSAVKGILGAIRRGSQHLADATPLAAAFAPIRAYHGSPHDFDRFELSKIGTGEGAQAYGHGLYFAENEGVARSYRDALSGDPLHSTLAARSNPVNAAAYDLLTGMDPDLVRKTLRGKGDVESLMAQASDLAAQHRGRMYEVNIHADPERFLDWDKPLSAQPQIAQAFQEVAPKPGWWSRQTGNLKDIRHSMATMPESSGEQAYGALGRLFGGHRGDDAKATAALREAGIPGIKYLDQGSRAAGDGSRNYVVFDDKLIDILRKYGLAGAAALPAGTLGSMFLPSRTEQ